MLRDIPEFEERMVKLYVQKLDRRTTGKISKKLESVISKYITRGITISDVFADNEFNNETYEQLVLPATLYICAKVEHVQICSRARSDTMELIK